MSTAAVVATNRRKALLARVHILRKELGLPEDEYRDILFKVTGKYSAADLNARGLSLWANHLQNLKNRYNPKKKHKYELKPQESKAWSLWQTLADQGKVKDRTMAGLLGYIKNHVERVDHIKWLNKEQLHNLIEQLKQWTLRV